MEIILLSGGSIILTLSHIFVAAYILEKQKYPKD